MIDPSKAKPSDPGDSIGKKIVLENRSRQTIAAVIVGKQIKANPTMRFVRRVDKPQIFVVDFAPLGQQNNPTIEGIISTRFSNWIDPNLFQLGISGRKGFSFKSMEIENYRIDPEKFADSKPDYNYRGTVGVAGQALAITKLETPNEKGEFVSTAAPVNQSTVVRELATCLGLTGRGMMVIHEVRPKDKKVAAALRAADAETPDAAFAPMAELGFRKTGFKDRNFVFESTGGRSTLTTNEGVKITATVGVRAGAVPGDGTKLTYHVLFTAGFDESRIPTLQPLAEGVSEDVIKEYKKKENAIKEIKENVRTTLEDLNAVFSDWYFVLDEDAISRLRPNLDIDVPVMNMEEEPNGEMKEPMDKSDQAKEPDAKKADEEMKKPEDTEASETEKSPAEPSSEKKDSAIDNKENDEKKDDR